MPENNDPAEVQAPSTDPVGVPETPTPTPGLAQLQSDLAAAKEDVANWKAQSRKHEGRAKASTNSEDVAAALVEARAEASADVQASMLNRVARAEIKAGLAEVSPDAVGLAEYLSTSKVTEGSEVDSEKLAALIEAVRPLFKKALPPALEQGATEAAKVSQYTKEDLRGKSPHWIEEQRKAGTLNDVLGIKE